MLYVPNATRKMTRGQALREVRSMYGLTQKYLGERLGVKGSVISEWESDKINLSDFYWTNLCMMYPVLTNMSVDDKFSKNILN